MLPVIINGRHIEARQGATILETCREAGIEVPTLCDDPRLKPIGACRLCVVEVKGAPHYPAACTTTVARDMHIETHSPGVERARRQILLLLAHDYPKAVVHAQPDKPFHRLLAQYHIDGTAGCFCCTPDRGQPLARHPGEPLRDASHPYINVDLSRCVLCFRCQRICDDVQGQHVLRVWNRGAATHLRPDGESLLHSSCVSCGSCVDACPTGALEDKLTLTRGPAANWTRSVCPYCGVGCEISVGTRAGKVIQVSPVHGAPVNRGHLCVKGRYAFGFVHARERITQPMLRENGAWRQVSWAEAIRTVSDRLLQTVDEFGSDSIGMLGSARATNEENYLTQKFARVVLGTNNVDCCARVCHAPSAAALSRMFGTGAAMNSFDDIERAATIVLSGCNPTENHPVLGARIKQAARHGARLIVIDPRQIELAREAHLHLAVRPGTNVPLFNAIAHVIIAENWVDPAARAERLDGFDAFADFVRDLTPAIAASVCGVPADAIRAAARLIGQHGPVLFFHGLGVTEHVQGTEGVMALANLALLTGNLGKPGAGVNPLRGQNNVQGAAHMGCEPAHLTGYASLAEARERFESIWQSPVPHTPGLNLLEMIDAAAAHQLKALWAIGYDVALTNPDANATRAALANVDFVVVQDLFMNELADEFAHVFLPACSSFEKEGTFMNSERRVQRVRKAIDPLGRSQPDWQIICAVAQAMGFAEHFAFHCAEEIWNEVRQVWPAGAGITYERLDVAGLQWPCTTENDPGTALLHRPGDGRRFQLQVIPFQCSGEIASDEFPFVLTTGRCLYAFNAHTMTGNTANRELRPFDLLDIAPADANRRGLKEGERVRLRSRHGEAVLRLHLDASVEPGELFATFHTADAMLNNVIGPARDRVTSTPEYKVVAVTLAPA